jgi:hypothetical protein
MHSCSVGRSLASTWRDALSFHPHLDAIGNKGLWTSPEGSNSLYSYQGTGRKLYIMKVDARNVISFTLTPPVALCFSCHAHWQPSISTRSAVLSRITNISIARGSPHFLTFPRFWERKSAHINVNYYRIQARRPVAVSYAVWSTARSWVLNQSVILDFTTKICKLFHVIVQ